MNHLFAVVSRFLFLFEAKTTDREDIFSTLDIRSTLVPSAPSNSSWNLADDRR
jgi:hypothetical protein